MSYSYINIPYFNSIYFHQYLAVCTNHISQYNVKFHFHFEQHPYNQHFPPIFPNLSLIPYRPKSTFSLTPKSSEAS